MVASSLPPVSGAWPVFRIVCSRVLARRPSSSRRRRICNTTRSSQRGFPSSIQMANSACKRRSPVNIRKLGVTVLATACLLGLAQVSYTDEEKAQAQPTSDAQRAAPNFVGISNWLNSGPLSITDLRGKVVLVDFWTYGCINCTRTLPHVTRLYDT